MEITMKKLALSSIAVAVGMASLAAQARVALDPQGVDLEPFLFVPSLEVGMRQDSNIYSLPSGQEVDSLVVTVAPTLRLVAQDRDNHYSVQYGLAAGLYSEDSNDNFIDHKLDVAAHFEPTSRFRFDVSGGYAILHDDRGTGFSEGKGLPFILAMSEPDQYTRMALGGGVGYGAEEAVGQIRFGLGLAQKRYDLDDRAAARDLDTLNMELGLSLRLMPKTKMLFDIEREQGKYDNASTAAVSDYTETRFLVGLAWEATGKTTGKVRLGNSNRELESGNDLSKFTWTAGVVWSPREHSRFTFDGGQRTNDGTLPTRAIENTNYTLGWEHDWSERLESRISYGMSTDDHDRVDNVKREDELTTIAASLNYQMRRWLVLGAGISLRSRDSTATGFEYDRDVYSLNALISL